MRIPSRSRCLVLFSVLLGAFLATASATFAQSRTKDSYYVQGYDLSESTTQIERTRFSSFAFTGTDGGFLPSQVVGKQFQPSIATKFVFVGIPEGASVRVQAKVMATEKRNGVILSPFDSQDSVATAYKEKFLDNPFYQSSTLYPADLAKVEGYTYIGGQYVAQIRISTLQYQPDKRLLTWNRLVKLDVEILPPPSNFSPTERHTTSDFDEQTLKRLLVNYREAKAWRQAEPLRMMQPMSASWYNPSNPYLKLYTAKDGVYRVTGATLASSGLNLSGVNPRTFKLYFKGREVPIRVIGEDNNQLDPTDIIEFIGYINRGEPEPVINPNSGLQTETVTEYLNVHSDTCVFWLTWGGEFGRRMAEENATPSNTTPQSTYRETRHYEQDTIYVTGFTSFDSITTERVPGEGWIWKRAQVNDFNTTDSLVQPFFVRNPAASGNGELQVRLVSATFTPATADIFLNNAFVMSISINTRGEFLRSASFPMSLLQVGENRLTLRLSQGAGSSVVDFDWFKLTGDFLFTLPPSNEQFEFSSSANADIVLANAQSSNNLIYNLSDSTILTNVAQVGNTLRFNAQAGKRYLATTASAYLTPIVRAHQNNDLRNPNNGADYIIITHPLFLSQANRLANFRQTSIGGGYRAKVVTTEDVYAEFSDGFFTPKAIQEFLKYAYNNWQQPRPKYVLLMGSGTWDPKNNYGFAQPLRKLPLIPVYGNPVSEIWFVSFENSPSRPFVNVPKMHIGRIPCVTLEEASTYVDKLIEITNRPLSQAWYKQFLFITGGIGSFEQQLFRANALNIINSSVLPAPTAGIVDTIFRDDDNPFVSSLAAERIQNRINSGTAVINFVGHAGSETWDFTLGDPRVLRNNGKYPLIFSWTCHTGRFAEPNRRTFGETFVFLPQAGATNFIGTAGYGYVGPDDVLNRASYRAIADTLREVGLIWNAAYQTLLAQTFFWSAINICTLDQYNIQGDPAQPIVVPRKPDFDIQPNDIAFQSQTIYEQDDQFVKVIARNFGIASPDSVNLRIYERAQGGGAFTKIADTLFSKILVRDSLIIRLNFRNRTGARELEFRVNENGNIDEVNPANNTARQTIIVFPNDVVGTMPYNFSVLPASNPAFSIISSSAGLGNGRTYQFELDTTMSFDSPAKRISGDLQEDTLLTTWRPQFNPILDIPYYWRVRIRNADGSTTPWRMQTVRFDTVNGSMSQIRWRQQGKQIGMNKLENVRVNTEGVTIASGEERLRLRSVGALMYDYFGRFFYEIAVGDCVLFNQVPPFTVQIRGLNISILDTAKSLYPTPVQNFDLLRALGVGGPPDTAVVPRLLALIDSLPQHAVLLVSLVDAVQDIPDGFAFLPFAPEVLNRFVQLGSARFGTLRFRESWVFAGSKDRRVYFEDWGRRCLPNSACDSALRPTVIDSVIRVPRRMALIETEPIGPAAQWGMLSWQASSLSPNAKTMITVIGIRRDGTSDSLLTISSGSQYNLMNLSATQYPYLKLRVKLLRDVPNGTSPSLQSLSLNFITTGDLATSNRLFTAARDTVRQGEPIDLTLQLQNIGMADVSPIRVDLSVQSPNAPSRRFLQSTVIDSALSPNQRRTLRFSVPTHTLTGTQVFSTELDPDNRLQEVSRFNNQALRQIFIAGDSLPPQVDITFNGQRVTSGALVPKKPRILITATDESPIPIADTALFSISLSNTPIYFSDSRVSFTPATPMNKTATVVFTPELPDGRDTLRVTVRDVSGNRADSAQSVVAFNVESDFKIQNLYNYPNPFRDETFFAFRMTGELDARPTEFKIRIYTVAGRMIKEIDVMPTLNESFNGNGDGLYRVRWDGRDNDGDLIANGVYIYRISIKTPKETINKTEKLAIIR
ncbi:MAG: C25 family cysteine peptidase [Chloroherpetonaceae bacterium]